MNTVIVIGGGASGLMAAIMAARAGAKVTLLEQNEKNGKKINATGNGKCNFTNRYWDDTVIRGEDPSFAQSALAQFTVKDTIDFFESLGMMVIDKNGYFYPRSGQASSVTELLTTEAKSCGVKMKTREFVKEIRKIDPKSSEPNQKQSWQVLTEGWHYEADCIILACGSCASSVSGSNDSGYTLAKSLKHTIITPVPALTGLRLKDPGKFFSKWAGVRCEGKISLYISDCFVISQTGELQLTEYGISGIPTFQISRYATRAILDGKKTEVVLDFMPDLSMEEWNSLFFSRKEKWPNRKEKDLFLGCFPEKLLETLSAKNTLIQTIKELRFTVKEGMPFSHAQVAAGGVSTKEVSPETMESKLQKGIYFVGELLDIDGTCGGYNLQWAWSSGAVAGIHAAGKEFP